MTAQHAVHGAAAAAETSGGSAGPQAPAPVRRLRRAERREQILDAATRAFARSGFTATSLDDVATEAGITRVLLYRHFDSKADLYRSVLDRACARVMAAMGDEDLQPEALGALLGAASADPDGFRLLFRHAAREPEFHDLVDELAATSSEVARHNLARVLAPGPWLTWAAAVVTAVTTEAVIAWLDAGQPDPEEAACRIGLVVDGIINAAGRPASDPAGG
ncbi:TetR/AcrR family transcriptional regulator [Yinghuangia sp. YIM S09857]|uniref:TetR/AcrR family transcriptional regulator n=1 Tax=Yinghuangia sp. YIM S09857 TaxID=3436929 RepID=UPI003F52EF9E